MKREDVREAFPECVKIADKFKRVFGQIILRHVSENGKTMGKQSPAGVKLSEIELSGNLNFKKEAK